jgi:hypothetical protein
MKVKLIGDKIQATVEPGEVLRLQGFPVDDPERKYAYPMISDAIRGGVWRLLQAHALEKLNGMKIGWGRVDFIDGNYVVTYGPAELSPDKIVIPEAK